MCYQRHKTPVSYPLCSGKKKGGCTTHDPERDYVEPCKDARTRGWNCPNPTPTSQGSSTKRGDCPNHRRKISPPPEKDDDETTGSSGGLEGSAVVVKAAA
ncbi:hypothetical protein BDV09DRAFT_168432 [Aspergillus tetrazonus]